MRVDAPSGAWVGVRTNGAAQRARADTRPPLQKTHLLQFALQRAARGGAACAQHAGGLAVALAQVAQDEGERGAVVDL